MNGKKATAVEVADKKMEPPPAATETVEGASEGRSTVLLLLLRRVECAQVALRLMSVLTAVVALTMMLLAKQDAEINVYGFQLPVRSKWSLSNSFEYLVGVSAAVAAHSLVQLLIGLLRLFRRSPLIPSRVHAWLMFAGDQVFAYALMSAGSAASGVTNLNRTGVKHTAFPKFCNTLHSFCDRVAVSISFTFLGCFLLAVTAILDVIRLSKY
uniref:CASP-like protein n=1 Tax=Kalanchoe fedtschenkoi TaxID=63787 RepID=A0A7N0TT62_KALFE